MTLLVIIAVGVVPTWAFGMTLGWLIAGMPLSEVRQAWRDGLGLA